MPKMVEVHGKRDGDKPRQFASDNQSALRFPSGLSFCKLRRLVLLTARPWIHVAMFLGVKDVDDYQHGWQPQGGIHGYLQRDWTSSLDGNRDLRSDGCPRAVHTLYAVCWKWTGDVRPCRWSAVWKRSEEQGPAGFGRCLFKRHALAWRQQGASFDVGTSVKSRQSPSDLSTIADRRKLQERMSAPIWLNQRAWFCSCNWMWCWEKRELLSQDSGYRASLIRETFIFKNPTAIKEEYEHREYTVRNIDGFCVASSSGIFIPDSRCQASW